jgi:hypothetical protein
MADLRSRFIEDYAGGLLNVARQELSTAGEVLAQDGLTSEGTLFVEDGTGTKSGLKLGVSLAEVVDPTTETGVVNVRYADRTYAKIRDLKIFSTAIASAQAALAEATSTSVSNLETTLQLLEDDISSIGENFQQNLATGQEQLQTLSLTQRDLLESKAVTDVKIQSLEARVLALEVPTSSPPEVVTLATSTNQLYYSGTIQIVGANVTGTGTAFDTQLDIGDVFVATVPAITAEGTTIPEEEVEFTVTSFDTTTPATKITVTPTSKTISSNVRFRRSRDLDLRKKINEIIGALKTLDLVV